MILEFLKANWLQVACGVGIALLALPSLKPLLGGLLGKLGGLVPGLAKPAPVDATHPVIALSDAIQRYRDALNELGVSPEEQDRLVRIAAGVEVPK